MDFDWKKRSFRRPYFHQSIEILVDLPSGWSLVQVACFRDDTGNEHRVSASVSSCCIWWKKGGPLLPLASTLPETQEVNFPALCGALLPKGLPQQRPGFFAPGPVPPSLTPWRVCDCCCMLREPSSSRAGRPGSNASATGDVEILTLALAHRPLFVHPATYAAQKPARWGCPNCKASGRSTLQPGWPGLQCAGWFQKAQSRVNEPCVCTRINLLSSGIPFSFRFFLFYNNISSS